MIDEIKTNFSNIHNELKNKLKLPIIITYSVVLIIFNWDILFYLAFENNSALKKIIYVKSNFFTENFERIWKPILYSISYSILFPFLQVLLNQIIQYFKRYNNKITRKEEIDNAVHNFEVQQQLTGQQSLQQLQNRIDQLILEKDKLINSNNSLISQLKSDSNDLLDSNSILNSEYDKTAKELFNEINEFNNEEKSTFLELISFLSNYNNSFYLKTLSTKTSYPQHTDKTLQILTNYKIIENSSNGTFKVSMFGLKFIEFFKSKYVK
ncbi:MAG: hypothetical protein RLZZ540_3088 [Bacteroidota bacterium]|jgi:hypothetical protein